MTPTARKVLAALQHLSADGLYRDGYARIATHAGCVLRTVTNSMAYLIESGHVEVLEQPSGNRASVLRLTSPPRAGDTSLGAATALDDLSQRIARLEETAALVPELVATIETIQGQQTILIDERRHRIEVAAKRSRFIETHLKPKLDELSTTNGDDA